MCAVHHGQRAFHMHRFVLSCATLVGLGGSRRLVSLRTCLYFKTMGKLNRGGHLAWEKLGRGGRPLGLRSYGEPHFAVACAHRVDLTCGCLVPDGPIRVWHRHMRLCVATLSQTPFRKTAPNMCFAMRTFLCETSTHTTTGAQDVPSPQRPRESPCPGSRSSEEPWDSWAWFVPCPRTAHGHRHGVCAACHSRAFFIAQSANPPQEAHAPDRSRPVPGMGENWRVTLC